MSNSSCDNRFALTTLAIVFLVALRISIGWYYFDGAGKKRMDRSFTSANFLSQAQGPLAGMFKIGLPDYHGWRKLMALPLQDEPNPHDANTDREKWEKFNRQSYIAWYDQIQEDWGRHKDTVSTHFSFDDDQGKRAGEVFTYYDNRLKQHLANYREDLEAYRHDLYRLQNMQDSSSAGDVPFEQSRISRKKAEIAAQAATLRGDVEAIEEEYNRELAGVATTEQYQKLGDVPESLSPLAMFDTFLIYTHFAIGACLVIGLMTRLAAFGAGAFLVMVVLSQPPWVVGFQTIGFQIVMMFASFLIMATPAGRWAGLDYFIHPWVSGKCCSATEKG